MHMHNFVYTNFIFKLINLTLVHHIKLNRGNTAKFSSLIDASCMCWETVNATSQGEKENSASQLT